MIAVHNNSINATVNSILKEWRDCWPGGLEDEQYSTLNLMAHCREGTLGYNYAKCGDCGHKEWYASSCGDRHCPNCLGPRQAQWSQKVCDRLPDCPHFHVVFTVPQELHDFFEDNYRIAATELFAAAAETLKAFQKNNWGVDGGFLAVLHTWGSALNWHPHLHVLVSAGGIERKTGKWKQARSDYMFAVKAMSKVFRAIMLRRIEDLEGKEGLQWPRELESVEERREWRFLLAGKNWNIFSKATLGNTRAVVRYLARYTSKIAMSNSRIIEVDEEERIVRFEWKNYRAGGRKEQREMNGKAFVRSFARHLVPKGLRRVRYFGLLAGSGAKKLEGKVKGAPTKGIGERVAESKPPLCTDCEGSNWKYIGFFIRPDAYGYKSRAEVKWEGPRAYNTREDCFSLVQTRAGP